MLNSLLLNLVQLRINGPVKALLAGFMVPDVHGVRTVIHFFDHHGFGVFDIPGCGRVTRRLAEGGASCLSFLAPRFAERVIKDLVVIRVDVFLSVTGVAKRLKDFQVPEPFNDEIGRAHV